ncbi:MAG: DMT family transporter [Oscillatoriales cyanobacterium]|nr:MAG: DMT family transporter [Oscillatoriales cyanobacterium]
MGPLEHPPAPIEAQTTEAVLQDFSQQLQALQQAFLQKLTQDLERLGAEKTQLALDIDRLDRYRQQLQARQTQAAQPNQSLLDPTSQEWAQQWAKQLAQHMGAYLKTAIDRHFQDLAAELATAGVSSGQPRSPLTTPELPNSGYATVIHGQLSSPVSDRLLIELDRSLQTTFTTLQQELDRYEQDLGDRVSRLASMQQASEALFLELVRRLQPTDRLAPDPPSGNSAPMPRSAPPPAARHSSALHRGLWMALASAVVLAIFNVILKLLLLGRQPETLLGLVSIPGVVTPTLGNALLILLLRTIAIALVFPAIATRLYPATWPEIRQLVQQPNGKLWGKILLNGGLLFVSQVALYVAIGNLPTGLAISLFFVYPIVTLPASWLLFGDRPTWVRWFTTGLILVGGCLALPGDVLAAGDIAIGTACAIGAGVAFAGYLLTVQSGTQSLHPVPFTLLSFCTTFVLCCLSFIIRPEFATVQINPEFWPWLLAGGVVLGLLMLLSYLLNNWAVKQAGATLTAIVSAANNALTALAALVLIQETLQASQWLGILLVTVGVALLSAERLILAKSRS